MAAAVFCDFASLSASSTALVISSTKRGMPSVRSIISLPNTPGESLVSHDAVNHCDDFALTKATKTKCGHVRPTDPGRLELRSKGDDQQDTESFQPVHCAAEHLRLVGSIQCTSSKITRIGLERESASNCADSASKVR